jgi:hypothetical protein
MNDKHSKRRCSPQRGFNSRENYRRQSNRLPSSRYLQSRCFDNHLLNATRVDCGNQERQAQFCAERESEGNCHFSPFRWYTHSKVSRHQQRTNSACHSYGDRGTRTWSKIPRLPAASKTRRIASPPDNCPSRTGNFATAFSEENMAGQVKASNATKPPISRTRLDSSARFWSAAVLCRFFWRAVLEPSPRDLFA